MPGTKGHSGGRREGAGRKPRRFSIEIGKRYGVHEKFPEGVLPMKVGTVIELDRSLFVLEFEDGERMTIFR